MNMIIFIVGTVTHSHLQLVHGPYHCISFVCLERGNGYSNACLSSHMVNIEHKLGAVVVGWTAQGTWPQHLWGGNKTVPAGCLCMLGIIQCAYISYIYHFDVESQEWASSTIGFRFNKP